MPLTYTADRIITNAAADLGKWVPGETLGTAEYATLSDSYDSVLAEVAKLISLDRDAIPAAYYQVISMMVSAFAAASFSEQPLEYEAKMWPLEQRLRYLIAQTPTYEILSVNYF